MSKCIRFELRAASVLAMAFSGFILEARAAERQCDGTPFGGSGHGNRSYDTTTVLGMLQARRGLWARPRPPAAQLPQTLDDAEDARQRESRQSRAGVVGRAPPNRAPRSSRRMSNPDGWIGNLNEPPSGQSLDSESPVSRDIPAPFPPTAPAPTISGTNSTPPDSGGALRGAGAPTNVNSPTEGANRFRDEADAQSSKPR
jgi:hypothetical protein